MQQTAQEGRRAGEAITSGGGIFGSLKSSVAGINKSVATTIESMTGLSLSTLGAGVAVGAVAKGMKDAVDAASDMSETVNKVSVVFGEGADEVLAFGESAATAMGMSKQEALAAAGTFGNLFVSMGMAADQSVEMSTGLVKLAGDLASFNNIDPGVALEKLRAGLVGETEPLRTLGVNLSEAAVQAKAMQMGLAETAKELTAADKAQARYALILEQTATAQGDFARTSDGLANQQRILNAQLTDAKAEIGEGLLPAYVELVQVLSKAATGFNLILTANDQINAALNEQSGNLGDASQSWDGYVEGLKESFAAAHLIVQEQDGQVKILKAVGNGLVDVTGDYELLNQRQLEAANSAANLDDISERLGDTYADKVSPALEDAAAKAAAFSEQMDTLKAATSGRGFGAQREEFAKDQAAIRAEIEETKAALAEAGVPEFMAPENAAKIEEYQKKLQSVNNTIYSLAEGVGIDWKTLANTKDLDSLELPEDVIDRFRELRGQSYELAGSIKDLGGLPYATDAQKEDIDEQRAKLEELQGELDETAKAHQMAMREMAFGMLQEAALSGIDKKTDEQKENILNNLTEIAKGFGLWDEETARAVEAINGSLDELEIEGKAGEVLDTLKQVADIDVPDKAVTFTAVVDEASIDGAEAEFLGLEKPVKKDLKINVDKTGADDLDDLGETKTVDYKVNVDPGASEETSKVLKDLEELPASKEFAYQVDADIDTPAELLEVLMGIEAQPDSKTFTFTADVSGLTELERMLELQNALGGAGGGGGGDDGEGDYDGRRASGGPVWAGRSYLVGEHGPELYIPATSGNILNATQTAQVAPTTNTTTLVTIQSLVINGMADGFAAAAQIQAVLGQAVAVSYNTGGEYIGG